LPGGIIGLMGALRQLIYKLTARKTP
jgi:hypothetical protein